MSSDSILSASYQAAEQIMKARSRATTRTFSAIPPHSFQGWRLCALFCRYVDDLVDRPMRANFSHLAEIRPCGGCH